MSHDDATHDAQTAAVAASTDAPAAAAAAAVDPTILQEMMLFFVHLALHSGKGWGVVPLTPSEAAGEPTLMDEDVRLYQEAVGSLRDMLRWQPQLLTPLLRFDGIALTSPYTPLSSMPPTLVCKNLRAADRGQTFSLVYAMKGPPNVHLYLCIIALQDATSFLCSGGSICARRRLHCIIMVLYDDAVTPQLISEGLLNTRHEQVRFDTALLLKQIAKSPQGHIFALAQLMHSTEAADAVPHHCLHFYRQFCELIKSIPDLPADVSSALSPCSTDRPKVIILCFWIPYQISLS